MQQKKKKKAIRAALWFNNLNFDEYLTRPEPEPVESRDTAESKPASAPADTMTVESAANEGTENKTDNPAALTPANMKEKHYQMQLRIFSAFEQMQICKRLSISIELTLTMVL